MQVAGGSGRPKCGGAANTALTWRRSDARYTDRLVGDDEPGRWLLRTLREAGINTAEWRSHARARRR